MIDYIRPRFFIMENVKGIISAPLKHTPLAERDKNDPEQHLGTVLDVILSEFNKLGYKTVYGVLDAVNYGVPQFRLEAEITKIFFCHSRPIFKCTKILLIAGVRSRIPLKI